MRGWEAPALGRIGIKYVRSRDDLAWYLASLHTLKRKQWPTVIAGKHNEGRLELFPLKVLALLVFTKPGEMAALSKCVVERVPTGAHYHQRPILGGVLVAFVFAIATPRPWT